MVKGAGVGKGDQNAASAGRNVDQYFDHDHDHRMYQYLDQYLTDHCTGAGSCVCARASALR